MNNDEVLTNGITVASLAGGSAPVVRGEGEEVVGQASLAVLPVPVALAAHALAAPPGLLVHLLVEAASGGPAVALASCGHGKYPLVEPLQGET